MKAIHITPDKQVNEVEVNGLADLQAAVKGYIEAIYLSDGSTMFVNEEYLYTFGPTDFNSIATDVCGLGGRPDIMLRNPILGPVIIVGPVDSNGDSTDVTDQARKWVKRVAREA